MLTLHARTIATETPEAVAAAIKRRLRQKFSITHSTIEIEHHACADDALAPAANPRPAAKSAND